MCTYNTYFVTVVKLKKKYIHEKKKYFKKEKYRTHTFVPVVKLKKNYIHEKKMYFKKEKRIYRYFIENFPPFFHYDY